MPKHREPAPGWRESVSKWLDSLKAATYSDGTLTTRRCQITQLSHELGGCPQDVEADDLVDYFAARSWKPETRKSARNACVSFFRWLKVTDRADDDPSEALPSVRRPQAHPRPCPDVVVLKALANADHEEKLMIRLAAEAGLRRCEIAKVKAGDLMRDLVGWSLIVVGKGDRQRIVPLGDDLADSIRIAASGHDGGYVFEGRWGGHVCTTYVGKRLSKLLGDGWTGHSLRHRYATVTYGATHDLLLVSKLLGHESVETTQRYVAMPDDRLRAAVKAVALGA